MRCGMLDAVLLRVGGLRGEGGLPFLSGGAVFFNARNYARTTHGPFA